MREHKILVTGGSGLLGRHLRKIMPKAMYPSHEELDVAYMSDFDEVYTKHKGPEIFVHLAAFTSPPKVDKDPWQALFTNIIGTANVVSFCAAMGIRLVYMSTDYVFRGDGTYYAEDEPVYPVNKYAWSKLGGECAVRMYDNSLIIRTSFGPDIFPYEKAFIDQYTSREPVSVTAERVAELVKSSLTGVIHIGSIRRTVFEFAQQSKPEVGEISREVVPFKVPGDTSLFTERYKQWKEKQDGKT